MHHTESKKQTRTNEYRGLSIIAAIRLDQANRGLRAVSQSTVRRLERQARQVLSSTTFAELAGLL